MVSNFVYLRIYYPEDSVVQALYVPNKNKKNGAPGFHLGLAGHTGFADSLKAKLKVLSSFVLCL